MKQLSVFFFGMILLTGCNNNKSWTAAEIQKSQKLCMDEVEGKLGETEAKKFCSCLLGKAMGMYPSYEAADKSITDEQGKKMGQACVKELGLGGATKEDEEGVNGTREKKKGGLFGGGEDNILDEGTTGNGWSKSDRNAFISPCQNQLANAGYSADKSRQVCDCILGKLEKKYSSLKDADERGGAAAGTRAQQECESGGGGDDSEDNN